ncbi:Ser-Thr-rich glycosyl-phosphatidyl-inositol-anchored membrane family-domain-containing protein [Xylogone sp. PMI_703]|nr:Ser-Thr-rich glycosyl-phosphatidyl-inositol-anchored membrane family-domain-containing protein [Xylogone sp. PMI_703]
MLFYKFPSFILLCLASIAAAQNPFTFTTLSSVTAGDQFNITWQPSTGTSNTVTIVLRSGDKDALKIVSTIAANIKNTGSYLWSVPTTLSTGSTYAFEIIDNGNKNIVNYSNQFSIISSNSAAPQSITTATATATGTTGTVIPSETTSTETPSPSTSSGSATASSDTTATTTTREYPSKSTGSAKSTSVSGHTNSTGSSERPQPSVATIGSLNGGSGHNQVISTFGAMVALGVAIVVVF